MRIMTKPALDAYLANDVIDTQLDRLSVPGDEQLVCQRWLRQTPAKRMIFNALYGDLLNAATRQRVLDVGGGLTAFTRRLVERHDYLLADILAHDCNTVARTMVSEFGRTFVHAADWATLPDRDWDLVIANDLFPNVDQRLELFLQRLLPHADRVRLALTFYTEPRSYMTRRLDADEILCVLAWDHRHLREVLARFEDRIACFDLGMLDQSNPSVYPNGRQVCLVELKGDLSQRAEIAA
jgi:hypothetical protein